MGYTYAARRIGELTEQITGEITKSMASCGYRASQALRTAEVEVLRGERNGRTYLVPNTKRKYRASAPGEAPAPRTGLFREMWKPGVSVQRSAGETVVHSTITSSLKVKNGMLLGDILEGGTRYMAPRRYQQAVIEKASPQIRRIYDTGIKVR